MYEKQRQYLDEQGYLIFKNVLSHQRKEWFDDGSQRSR